ncbi:MAG: tRNA dihydrouridine synthase DusB [Bacilli bacterium]|nr:tRNA dihydrouridine synthase DusB [Bacilli bacterium]
MKIGDKELDHRVILGPMAGVTNLPYREFMKPFGVGLTVSEMISDCGICYNNENTLRYLATSKEEGPVALQLFGSKIESSVKAIGIMEERAAYDILDINFGCPVNKVTKTGAGSAWLARPEEMEEYVKAIVSASHKPVTAKIRLGIDDKSINVFPVSKMLESAGVSAISVHCRTKEQGYSGKPDYEAIRGLQSELSIPLFVSGDIFDLNAIKKVEKICKPAGYMVARGGVGNPYLVTQINAYLEEGKELPNPSLEEQVAYARTYMNKMIDYYGEATGVILMRTVLPSFFHDFPHVKSIRIAMMSAYHKEELEQIFEGALDRIA